MSIILHCPYTPIKESFNDLKKKKKQKKKIKKKTKRTLTESAMTSYPRTKIKINLFPASVVSVPSQVKLM